MVKIEQAIKRDLLNLTTQTNLYAKFNVSALMRGDAASRASYYQTMWGIGTLSINEIRTLEDYNAIDDGTAHFVPMNFQELGAEPIPEPEPEPVIEDEPSMDEEEAERFDISHIVNCQRAASIS